jgi:hypothetical protein
MVTTRDVAAGETLFRQTMFTNNSLKVHKHEIIWNFFLPKSNPYMPLINFRKNFASFPSIFARISKFEHFRGDQIFWGRYGIKKKKILKKFTLALLDGFLNGFLKFRFL